MRDLLCTQGEAPLSAAEWADLLKMADPTGSGVIKAKALKGMPCWVPPPQPAVLQERLSRRNTPRKLEDEGGSGGAS